jgi:hypothetical protein
VHTMKRRVCLGLAALAFASCSSDSASAPPTIGGTLAPSTEQTPAPTTSAPTTTSTPTTTIETTTLPATTTTLATEDLIKTAVQDYIADFFSCGQKPAECDPSTFTAVQGHSRATLTELSTGMAQQGLYFSTDIRGSYLVSESFNAESDTRATAIYCAFDALTVLGPNGPDGLPTIVNDEMLSLRNEYVLFFEDAAWRVGEQNQQEQLGEGNACPPAE